MIRRWASNPPHGAIINYYLKSAPAATWRWRDPGRKGQTIRTLNGPRGAGVHRVYWDLRDTRGEAGGLYELARCLRPTSASDPMGSAPARADLAAAAACSPSFSHRALTR